MTDKEPKPVEALILVLPESVGSAIYGLKDVFASAGTLWPLLVGEKPGRTIRTRTVSLSRDPFHCRHGIPILPDLILDEAEDVDMIVIPGLWLAPDDSLSDRYGAVKDWLRRRSQAGCEIYTACAGSVLLAAAGLLKGKMATSHWGYADLFRRHYPDIRFVPASVVVFADESGRIVTAGGASAWQDLALHIVSRHCSPGEALHLAKAYMLQWHSDGQQPFAGPLRPRSHADSAVRRAEEWLRHHFRAPQPVAGAVEESGIPERSLKRRFAAATGSTVIGYVQALRIEEAKRLLETGTLAFDEIAAAVGYENPAFFRKLFKRCTGMTAGNYRRLFRPIFETGLAGNR